MKLAATMLLSAIALSSATVASAAAVLDQDAFTAPPSGPPTTGYVVASIGTPPTTGLPRTSVIGQTVTAGKTGTLSAIELQRISTSVSNGFFQLSLFNNDLAAGGALVGSVTTPTVAGANGYVFDVSSLNYAVTAGQLFSFSIGFLGNIPGQTAAVTIGTFAGASFPSPPPILNYNLYAGGQRYLSVNGGNYVFQPNGDVTFRTYVTQAAAVPEPATWGLLIIGFGAIGLTLRARRRQDQAARLCA